jgi:hypothetical protein
VAITVSERRAARRLACPQFVDGTYLQSSIESEDQFMPVTVLSFTTPAGTLVPVLSGAKYTAAFSPTATFKAGSGETCAPGEYRQYVQGVFKAAGSVLTHVLCGQVVMRADAYLEDGCPSGTCTAYGHRSCPTGPLDQYTPDQATGCNFSMYDEPGFHSVVKGTSYSIALDFKGQLINTAAGGAVLQEKLWSVTGSTVVPAKAEATVAAVKLMETDKIVMAFNTQNADSGAPEFHLIISRPVGRPPLDPASLGLTLQDASGQSVQPSAPPAVHEVAGRVRSTANVVFPLAPSANAPAMTHLAVNGAIVTLKVGTR